MKERQRTDALMTSNVFQPWLVQKNLNRNYQCVPQTISSFENNTMTGQILGPPKTFIGQTVLKSQSVAQLAHI
tara:strand:+ start:280 stop:498 length:219 start_codon:yes stop_codon:yes gene_type:complete